VHRVVARRRVRQAKDVALAVRAEEISDAIELTVATSIDALLRDIDRASETRNA